MKEESIAPKGYEANGQVHKNEQDASDNKPTYHNQAGRNGRRAFQRHLRLRCNIWAAQGLDVVIQCVDDEGVADRRSPVFDNIQAGLWSPGIELVE